MANALAWVGDKLPVPDVAWWKVNEGGGTSLNDSSGNGYTGNFVNGGTPIAWTSGPNGVAAIHLFPSSYVDCGTGPSRLNGPFTYSFWVNFDNVSSGFQQNMIGSDGNGNVYIGNADRALVVNSQDLSTVVNFGTVYPVSGWSFTVFTYDALGNYVGYQNGASIGSGTSLFTFATHKTLIGGAPPDAAWLNPGGLMTDIRIYGRVLTSTEVTALYNAGAV